MKLPLLHFKSGPERDWKVILSVSILLVLALIIFNIFFFSSQSPETAEEISPQSLNLDKLKQTISYYQAKEKEFQRIIKNYDSPFSDPSI